MPSLKYFNAQRHATWLELFFDLVFVACIGTLTHRLGHLHDGHVSTSQLIWFLIEFIPIWWLWASHTYYSNRFDTDSRGQRIVSLIIILLVVTLAASLGSEVLARHRSFIGLYALTRLVQAGMYLFAGSHHPASERYAKVMATLISMSAVTASSSLLFGSLWLHTVLLGFIGIEMVLTVLVTRRLARVPVHRAHLVERIGLLSLILLGESVISMVGGLRDITWNPTSITATITGFVMICAIWWIYFDTFPVLEHAKRIKNGFEVLYSHLVFCIGLVLLANLIGHTILNDMGHETFRLFAIGGMTLFYIGKQTPYFMAFPIFRINTVVNSTICIGVTIASTFLPEPHVALIGITLGMLFYVYANFTWTLKKDASPYLVDSHDA